MKEPADHAGNGTCRDGALTGAVRLCWEERPHLRASEHFPAGAVCTRGLLEDLSGSPGSAGKGGHVTQTAGAGVEGVTDGMFGRWPMAADCVL